MESHFLDLMVYVIAGLVGAMFAALGYFARRMNEKSDRIEEKLNVLMLQRSDCRTEFSNASQNTDDHRRIWARIDEHDRAIATIKGQLSKTEDDGK